MPCNYKDYHPNWKMISQTVIAKANNRCELCYAPNGRVVARSKSGDHPWSHVGFARLIGEKETKIILTVHHINGDKEDDSEYNLIALCQRCHLRLDMGKHIANRRKKYER
jgi:hypothetical protein